MQIKHSEHTSQFINLHSFKLDPPHSVLHRQIAALIHVTPFID